MEVKNTVLVRELYQVACMIERARTPEGMMMFSEKQYLQKETERMWSTVGPHHHISFQMFNLLKTSEERYKDFIKG
jgi:transcriptional regulatory protein LevR